MQITLETGDNVAIIKISGRMVFDESMFLLRVHVQDSLRSGIERFVIDISEVPYLDSSACGEVIGAYTSIAKAHGSLAFVNPTERVRVLWTRIKIVEILPIFDTLDDALKFVRRNPDS